MRTLERERRFASVLFQSASNGYFYFRVLPKDVTRTWTYQGMVTTYKDRDGRIIVTNPDPENNTVLEEWKDSLTGPTIHSIFTQYDSAGGMFAASEYDGTVATGTIKSTVTFDVDQFGRTSVLKGHLESKID